MLTAGLTVKIDPRVEASHADLESLFKLEYQLSGMVSSSAEAALAAHSSREQIEKLSNSASPEIKESLEKQDRDLSALLSGKEKSATSEEEPGLDEVAGEAASLYTQVGMADALPTVIQQKSSEQLGKELSEVLEKWEGLKRSIPQLNQKLSAAHLPKINPEQKPESMPESGDED